MLLNEKSTNFGALIAFLFSTASIAAQQAFPVISTMDAPTIAGRPVALDASGKLLPWPVPNDTGYSYSAYFLSQWTILWDQYNRQRLPYYFCCFDFDRTTFELTPDPNWVNSTGYLRAMRDRLGTRRVADRNARWESSGRLRWHYQT